MTPFDMSGTFQQKVNDGDLEGLLGLLSPEAVSRTVQGEVLTDPAKIRADLAGLLSARPHLVNTVRHIFSSGDVALMLIDWTLEVDTPDGRAQAAGTTTNVVRRGHDGEWRLAILNPIGTAA
ncbi:putative hydrolase [Actinoplanes sp. SE50]|uniref:YybH family protein n=1 Tax=unclassified Actinoplanes TaxID=2626549 RepID=UPI00023EC96B|nr:MULTISPECIES: nuclear transport factor 2 family protein [unclassified Actinoplanes]AEV84251.1 putative hydrolase [Actinoplanes sp. SE50/110]ATO82643.1 putative hydrolase [Actinoplanes sp. SE50]SLM00050.1 hydrolase [Actinoplanes sp. SE50/110]